MLKINFLVSRNFTKKLILAKKKFVREKSVVQAHKKLHYELLKKKLK